MLTRTERGGVTKDPVLSAGESGFEARLRESFPATLSAVGI